MNRWIIALAMGLVAALSMADTAAAHPLGNFTVNQYSRIEAELDQLRLRYLLDMAEIPAFQERQQIDRDRDEMLSAAEQQAYLDRQVPQLIQGLRLSVDGRPAPLRLAARAIEFPAGEGGLQTLRITLDLTTELPPGVTPRAIGYSVENYPERLGWREIVTRAGSGVELRDSSALAEDRSRELRAYPETMLASPLDMRSAVFTLLPGNAQASAPGQDSAEQIIPPTLSTNTLASLLAARDLTPAAMAVALLLALALGAGHALAPGHGKTVVAAYLVGARGTTRHAIALGLVTTITHTAGVFGLGLVTLLASRYVLPERIYPWLELISGGLVVLLGLGLLRSRLTNLLGHRTHDHHHHHHHGHDNDHDHNHDNHHGHGHGHSHDHEQLMADTLAGSGGTVTWRGLIALGVSGGLLPCPTALVVLLAAIALGRVGFGLLLILAFSMGLAAVLTTIGIILVHARTLLRLFPSDGWISRALPAASALVVVVAGVAITAAAVARL